MQPPPLSTFKTFSSLQKETLCSVQAFVKTLQLPTEPTVWQGRPLPTLLCHYSAPWAQDSSLGLHDLLPIMMSGKWRVMSCGVFVNPGTAILRPPQCPPVKCFNPLWLYILQERKPFANFLWCSFTTTSNHLHPQYAIWHSWTSRITWELDRNRSSWVSSQTYWMGVWQQGPGICV